MKQRLSEKIQAFIHGAVFSLLASNMSNLLNAIIALVALESIWLI